MKLRPIGSNQTEVEIGKYTILFSYQTPVAYHKVGSGYFYTGHKYSPTTSRHVNKWLLDRGGSAECVPHAIFLETMESLLGS